MFSRYTFRLCVLPEYDALSRLGISDAKTYIQKRLKGESLQYLSTCCVGRAIQENVEAEVEEALASGGWVDVLVSVGYMKLQ